MIKKNGFKAVKNELNVIFEDSRENLEVKCWLMAPPAGDFFKSVKFWLNLIELNTDFDWFKVHLF